MKKILAALFLMAIGLSGVLHAKMKVIPVVTSGYVGDSVNAENLAEYVKACEGGESAEKCYELSGYYFTGRNTEQDYEKVKTYAGFACSGGIKDACEIVDGIGRIQTSEKKIEKLQSEDDDSNVITSGSLEEKVALYEKRCNEGDIDFCLLLVGIYLDGEETPEDYSKVRFWSKKACDLGGDLGCQAAELVQEEIELSK